MIIHISGPSGSGKTTLGKAIKQKLKSRVLVKDLDDLRDEFKLKKYANELKSGKNWSLDENKYQQYIYDFIKRNSRRNIVFVGLNDNPLGKKKIFYDLCAEYKFYIELEPEYILKQKCIRLLNEIQNDKMAMEDLVNNNKIFVKRFQWEIKHECDKDALIKDKKNIERHYTRMDYKFMRRNDIFTKVIKLLSVKRA